MVAEFQLRGATTSDVDQLVELHYRVFDESTHHLMVLGRNFIKRAYLWYCTAPDAFALVAENPQGIAGCATMNLGSYYRIIRANWLLVLRAFALRPGLCFEPWVCCRICTLG